MEAHGAAGEPNGANNHKKNKNDEFFRSFSIA